MAKKKRATPAEKKKLLVETAMQIILEQGPHGFKFNELSRRAKVDQPLIKYYFPNFESLFAAMVQVVLEDLKNSMIEAILAGGEDPERALANYMVSPLRWSQEKREMQTIWTYFYTLSTINPQLRALNHQIRQGGRERIELLIFKILEHRKCRLSENYTVSDLALSIQSIITGYNTMMVTEDSDLERMQRLSFQNALDLIDKAFIKD